MNLDLLTVGLWFGGALTFSLTAACGNFIIGLFNLCMIHIVSDYY